MTALAVDPDNANRIWLGAADGGVFRSTDGGTSWQQVLFVAEDAGAFDVAIDPATPSRIHAAIWERYSTATEWIAGGASSGILQSVDGGSTWVRLTNGFPAPSPTVGRIGLAIATSSPAIVYAIYRDSPGALMGIWKTTNAGASWFRVDSPGGAHVAQFSDFGFYFGQIRVDPANPGLVYALDVDWYRSTDGGVKWQQKGNGIHVDHHDLIVLPGGRLLMGNDGGFYSSPNGSNWTQVDPPGRSEWVTAVEADPFDARTAYLTLSGSREGSFVPHVLRTTTLGASWIDISGNLPQVPLNCLALDPDWRGRLFVGCDAGVFMTEDGGASWTAMRSGMPPVVVLDLDLIERARTLYAATHGCSLYSLDLNQLPPPVPDGVGVVNSLDCASDDAGAFAVPGEVTALSFLAGGASLVWSSAAPGAGSGTLHDLLRGHLRQLPVGSGGSEICVARGMSSTAAADAASPAPGSGYRYLVRGRNVCGPGPYGVRSDGTPRSAAACDAPR